MQFSHLNFSYIQLKVTFVGKLWSPIFGDAIREVLLQQITLSVQGRTSTTENRILNNMEQHKGFIRLHQRNTKLRQNRQAICPSLDLLLRNEAWLEIFNSLLFFTETSKNGKRCHTNSGAKDERILKTLLRLILVTVSRKCKDRKCRMES